MASRSSPWEGAEAEPLDGTWLSGEIALRHLNRVHLVLDGVHYLLAEQGSSFFDLGSLDFIYNNIIFLRSTGLILCGPFDFGPLAKLPVCEALGLSHICMYTYICIYI